MHVDLVDLLAGPDDGGPLVLDISSKDENGEVLQGMLRDSAGRSYPIDEGIPRLLPFRLLDAQKSEMAARDAQVDEYDRMRFLQLFGKVEIPLTLSALDLSRSDRLLEAGCGTGRMTQTFSMKSADVVAIDLSFESLRVNRRKLVAAGVRNVHLVQADLCHLPFITKTFDRVVSCQVLEHVPTEGARLAAVSELARVSKSRAKVVVSAYQHSIFTRMFGDKQGEHAGGIPYYRFSASELRTLLGSAMEVVRITGSLVYLHLASCYVAADHSVSI